jgi:methionine-S-sulfoxide reductase
MTLLTLILLIITTETHSFVSLSSKFPFLPPLLATRQATFGAGCFWKPSEELLKVDGVIDTIAGYTGKADATEPPTYDDVCFSRDWVEGVRVIFDDERLSYQDLLDAFYEHQEPKPGYRQYGSFIFPHDEEQELIAREWKQTCSRERKDGFKPEWTEVEPLSTFWRAEEYHQRYWEKQRPRFAAIIAMLAVSSGLIDHVIPPDLLSPLHTGCNAICLGVAVFLLLERKFDTRVVELPP